MPRYNVAVRTEEQTIAIIKRDLRTNPWYEGRLTQLRFWSRRHQIEEEPRVQRFLNCQIQREERRSV